LLLLLLLSSTSVVIGLIALFLIFFCLGFSIYKF